MLLDNGLYGIVLVMLSANLLVEARRRAGLTQRELAARAGVGQQEVARYERGRVTPSLERLRQLIASCGLELTFGLARADCSYDDAIARALAIPPAQRLARGLQDAESVRAVGAHAHGTPPSPDLLGVLRTLAKVGVRCILIAELAEVLRGSPLLPMSGAVTIVPRAGEREMLSDAIAAGRGRNASQSAQAPLDAVERWHLRDFDAELVAQAAPAGTHGYEDLRRDATQLHVDDGLNVTVASLVDLIRIGEASNDRARMPALRRTLELATDPASAQGAHAA
jgi:transcriptional regulator with XRE-family HTH domain